MDWSKRIQQSKLADAFFSSAPIEQLMMDDATLGCSVAGSSLPMDIYLLELE
jgi:hypothetical protein